MAQKSRYWDIPREIRISKRYMYPKVHGSAIYNSQDMEATQMSINRGMDKEDAVHLCNGILLSHKKEQNWIIRDTWMDLETVIQSEVSQKEKSNIVH